MWKHSINQQNVNNRQMSHLPIKQNEFNTNKLREIQQQQMQNNDICVYCPFDDGELKYDERFDFIETHIDKMPTSLTVSTSSSMSSLTSVSSPSHLTPTHIKLKPTLIPAQYRVYIPQKKCQMKEAYTDYMYNTEQTLNQLTHIRKINCDDFTNNSRAHTNKHYVNAKAT